MGQAKQRGTFEQRQAAAIERRDAEAKAAQALRDERRRAEREAEMALPQVVRERRREARFQTTAKIAMLVGMAAASIVAMQPKRKGKSHG